VVEANLFSRLVRVVKAYVTNFTEQFEDPELLLDRVTDEMQEDLIKMRQATAKVRAAQAMGDTGLVLWGCAVGVC
jgi:phage shock protein A